MAFANVDSIAGSGGIAHQGGSSTNTDWAFNQTGGNWQQWDGGIGLNGPACTPGWHHLAAVYDGTNSIFYVDGVFAISGVDTAINTTITQLRIGANGDVNYFFGFINDVKLWDDVRTPDQIATYYASVSSTYAKIPELILDYQFALSGSYDHSPYTLMPTATTAGTIEVKDMYKVVGAEFGFAENEYLTIDPAQLYKTAYRRPRTLMGWISPFVDTGQGFLASVGSGTSNAEWAIGQTGGTWAIYDGIGTVLGPDCTYGWHHLAGVYDGTNSILYVDGVFAASAVDVSINTTEIGPLRIGTDSDLLYLEGFTNDVKLWDAVRTPDQVLTYFSETSATYQDKPDDLIFNYQFSSVSGSYDHSDYTLQPTATGGTIPVESIEGAEGGLFTGTQYVRFDTGQLYKVQQRSPKIIMAWVYDTDLVTGVRIAAHFGSTASHADWGVGANATNWVGYRDFVVVTDGAVAGGWHHLAFSYDPVNSLQTLYVDGVSAAEAVYATLITAETELAIGGAASALSDWRGYVNDVKIWSTAKDGSYIESYFASTSSIYVSG